MEESALLNISRGFINEDFRFFHLRDKKSEEHTFHYHDFNKIVVFISGNVSYVIEGKQYKLKPWDILFVSSNEVHKPIIDPEEHYERIILWVNSDFLIKHSTEEYDLLTCFGLSIKEKLNLLRPGSEHLGPIKNNLFALEKEIRDKDFGGKILQNAYFLQLIVQLNRLVLRMKDKKEEKDIQFDERIVNILSYINENIDQGLSIDHIAAKFYISRYYLMHHFKEQTGYTLHHYILQKRLAKAASLIKKGLQLSYISDRCGFQDYSSFVRAFKKSFGLSPKQYYNAIIELQHSYGEAVPEERDTYPYRE